MRKVRRKGRKRMFINKRQHSVPECLAYDLDCKHTWDILCRVPVLTGNLAKAEESDVAIPL
jgi:hypothetical protein